MSIDVTPAGERKESVCWWTKTRNRTDFCGNSTIPFSSRYYTYHNSLKRTISKSPHWWADLHSLSSSYSWAPILPNHLLFNTYCKKQIVWILGITTGTPHLLLVVLLLQQEQQQQERTPAGATKNHQHQQSPDGKPNMLWCCPTPHII